MGAIRTQLKDTWAGTQLMTHGLGTQLKDTQAGDTAQSKDLSQKMPCKHQDLSLIFRTHENMKQKVNVVVCACNHSLC